MRPVGGVAAHDALHQEGEGGEALEPGEVAPGEGGVVAGGDVAGQHRLLLERGAEASVARQVGHREARRQRELVPLVGEAPAEQRRVDREDARLVPGALGPLDQGAGEVPILVDVELEPLGPLGGAGDVLEAGRGQGGDDVEAAGGRGGARGADLAVGVGHPVVGRGRDEDGGGHLGAEEGGGEPALGDVHEDAVPDLPPPEGAAVLAERALVVGAGAVVVGGEPGEHAEGGGLEVVDGQQAIEHGVISISLERGYGGLPIV